MKHKRGELFLQQERNLSGKSLKFYLEKLHPKCDAFFQRPKQVAFTSGNWYDNQVVGKKSLGQLMKVISREINLSIMYTNHSIRATSVTVLDEAGLEAHHILAVSGHRSERIIQNYSRTGFNKKKDNVGYNNRLLLFC